MVSVQVGGDVNFYPRSPCGERRQTPDEWLVVAWTFLSTLSLRRATRLLAADEVHHVISIHALLAESDGISVDTLTSYITFLSTLSLRRATRETTSIKPIFSISIHALLAESDPPRVLRQPTATGFLSTLSLRRATWPPVRDVIQWEDFYPRSPCGERQPPGIYLIIRLLFLSTLSLRRATCRAYNAC